MVVGNRYDGSEVGRDSGSGCTDTVFELYVVRIGATVSYYSNIQ